MQARHDKAAFMAHTDDVRNCFVYVCVRTSAFIFELAAAFDDAIS